MLEAGTRPWSPRWASGAASLPLRHEGTAYRGVNVLLLWSATMTHGYTNPYWMTYRQASELGGQVRKGKRETLSSMPEASRPRMRKPGRRGQGRARAKTAPAAT
ncbi:ArdC-like ssDNA-binding domain-containing protein [Sphingobium chungangianum]